MGGGFKICIERGGISNPHNDLASGGRNNRVYTKGKGVGSDGGGGKVREATRRGEHPYFLGGELSVKV